MKVKIKSFGVDMEVKSTGIEFEVRTPNDSAQIGDCYLIMTGLTWCEGKKHKKNGIHITWNDFRTIMKSEETLKAAISAAKSQR